LIENRASKAYKNFIDIFIFYKNLFDNNGSIFDVLNMPYPLFSDIILAKNEDMKKRQENVEHLIS